MSGEESVVFWLDEPEAADPALTGAKAATLAAAAAADLPVIPGFVITTTATDAEDADGIAADSRVRRAWEQLSDCGATPLVVRSSSLAEDMADSSMAGRFESVVGVREWEQFVDAITTVLESRTALADAGEDAGHAPLAVLVQPEVEAASGGVMFSADPVTGDERVIVVSAVDSGPDGLVSGAVNGSTYKLNRAGEITSADRAGDGAELDAATAAELAALAQRCVEHFDGAQDMEWALDSEGLLWLLQTRPMTTTVGIPSGPLLGPGPVSESFPEALYPLESDLWVPPLRRAVREALLLSGIRRRKVDSSPLVVVSGGRIAVDLELFNAAPPAPTPWYQRLNPMPRLQRLRSAWRVGRLESALPGLAEDLIGRVDADLGAVPRLDDLTCRQLLALLERGSQALAALHGHEILVGLLVNDGQSQLTGAGLALRTLVQARAAGLRDPEVVAKHPVVLALTSPRIGGDHEFPPTDDVMLEPLVTAGGERDALLREALRLRVRWVQELQARAAFLLGEALVDEGKLSAPILVRRLTLEELIEVIHGRAVPWQVHQHRRAPDPTPLPAAFRLSTDGAVLPAAGGAAGRGQGAGGGSTEGTVHHYNDGDQPPEDSVLVVRNLSPSLATQLSRVRALVAETGSPLAHVAILAREQGIPTVVSLQGAFDEFDDGDVVAVDGTTGRVERAEATQ